MNTSTSKTPGKGLFVAGCITLLLFGAVHMIRMFIDLFGEPAEPVEVDAKRAMAAVSVDIGPFHTHFGKLDQLLSTSYSALLFFIVALNFVALPAVTACGRLRAMAAVNVIFVGILLAIAVIFVFPPPGVFSLIAEVFFVGAMVRSKPRVPEPYSAHR